MILVIQQSVGTFELTNEVVSVYEVADFGFPSGIETSLLTAKGQLVGASAAATPVAVPASDTDGKVLTARSGQTPGVNWEFPSVSVDDQTNYLINPGFRFTQRIALSAYTTIADNAYGLDRWKCHRANADLQVGRYSDGGTTGFYAKYMKKITNAGKIMTSQILEAVPTLMLRGREMIFQIKLGASVARTMKIALIAHTGGVDTPATLVAAWNADTVNPTLGANISVIGSVKSCAVTTAWQQFYVTATIPTNTVNLFVAIWSDTNFAVNDVLYLAEAGLYTGSQTRAWSFRPIQQELALCQRYFCKTFDIDTAPATATGGNNSIAFMAGKAGAAANLVTWRFPVEMRATPTVTIYNPSAANAQVRDASAGVDCSATSTPYVGSQAVTVQATGNAATAVGNQLLLHASASVDI